MYGAKGRSAWMGQKSKTLTRFWINYFLSYIHLELHFAKFNCFVGNCMELMISLMWATFLTRTVPRATLYF